MCKCEVILYDPVTFKVGWLRAGRKYLSSVETLWLEYSFTSLFCVWIIFSIIYIKWWKILGFNKHNLVLQLFYLTIWMKNLSGTSLVFSIGKTNSIYRCRNPFWCMFRWASDSRWDCYYPFFIVVFSCLTFIPNIYCFHGLHQTCSTWHLMYPIYNIYSFLL